MSPAVFGSDKINAARRAGQIGCGDSGYSRCTPTEKGTLTVRQPAPPFVALVLLAVMVAGCSTGPPAPSTPAFPSSAGVPSGPTPSQPTTSPAEVGFPPGLADAESGVIYAESDGTVLRIHLATRTVQRSFTPRLEQFRDFVATRQFLAVKLVGGSDGYLVGPDGGITDLPAIFADPNQRLWQAGPDSVWLVPESTSGGPFEIVRIDTRSMKVVQRRSVN